MAAINEPEAAHSPQEQAGFAGGQENILEMRDIARVYGHVQALQGVDLDLRRGETLGVVGDNGAGKSTLMKIAAGAVKPDRGEILIDGTRVSFNSPADARRHGIEMIYQHLALFDNLDVAANIFLGREPTRGPRGLLGLVDRGTTHKTARKLLDRLQIDIRSTKLLVKDLSGGQRQMVAIARAVAFEDQARIIIMDEPSAALGSTESSTVLDVIRALKLEGHSVMMISHRLPEVLEHCDRVAILKQGECVAVLPTSSCSLEQCVNLIVGGRAALGAAT